MQYLHAYLCGFCVACGVYTLLTDVNPATTSLLFGLSAFNLLHSILAATHRAK